MDAMNAMDAMNVMERESVESLRERNARLEDELELLRGVLALVKEDLHVKNDQVDHLYHTYAAFIFLASREHTRREQEQRENALKQQVGELQTQIQASELSYWRLHTSRMLTVATSGHSPQLHELPVVLIVNVFSYLDTRSVVRAGSAHRLLQAVTACNAFWEGIYALRWRQADIKQGFERVRVFAAKYGLGPVSTEQNCRSADRATASAPESKPVEAATNAVDWHALYRERHIVERNWVNGRALITTLNGHNGTVTCLQFDGSRLVSGSDDGSMMLWSLHSPDEEPQREFGASTASLQAGQHSMLMQQHHRQRKSVVKLHSFFGHGGPVWALHFRDSTLVSGSYDKTVKIWDLQSGKCSHTLRGHTGWVSSLDCHERLIASASWDSSINIWDAESGALLRSLVDTPASPVYSLQWDHQRNALITGCRRFGIQVWDVESGQKTAHFSGHNSKNQINISCDERVISGGSDHSVKFWDRRQGACTATLVGHRGAVMSVDYDLDNKVISGSYDSVIKMWDLRHSSAPISTFEGHSSAVFSLQMDATKMISGSADTTIKIFRFL
ncbi:hypothetical protein PybrP1_002668 [[Pythium] brassicae (nom. inval.)]|nr:hypothetical protein PybrP1_002668 [[Pythium] brassicae (nom. inval.)]